MGASAITLSSRALLLIGAEPIDSFEDAEHEVEAEVSANLYPSVRDELLSAHPWSFATAQRELAALANVPVADFDHAYQLPADFLRVVSIGDAAIEQGAGIPYRIHENRIHADIEPLILTYIFRAPEENWPGFFDAAVIHKLAAQFCMTLTENTSRTEMLEARAEHQFRIAKSIDSQQQTPRRLVSNALTRARRI